MCGLIPIASFPNRQMKVGDRAGRIEWRFTIQPAERAQPQVHSALFTPALLQTASLVDATQDIVKLLPEY